MKISKIALLFMLIISLVGCSSVPTNLSKDVYNEIIKIQSDIDKCFNDESCNYLEVNEVANNSLLKIKPTTEEEDRLLLDSIHLLTTLIVYKTEFNDVALMQLELDYKKLHNAISKQLNNKQKYLN